MDFITVLKFWFEEITTEQHWKKDPEFDSLISDRFKETHKAAMAGELFQWRESAEGALAEIIVLDQFSRNIYRDKTEAFASDSLALCLAQNAISRGYHKEVSPERRSFLYMPYMHSESKKIHLEAVKIFGDPEWGSSALDFELKHKTIIDRFGRYPHRNEILGRKSTPEEVEFLKGPDSSF